MPPGDRPKVDYEVVIPAASKDFNKIPYLLSSLHYLSPQMKRVTIVCDRYDLLNDVLKNTYTKYPLAVVYERDVLDLNPTLAYRFRRPQWIYQQFLKLFQDITETDYYLIIDSDLIFNKPLRLFSDGNRPKFFLGNDQNHAPYFRYSRDMFGFGREYDYSFISEIMLMKKSINHALLSDFHFYQSQVVDDRKINNHHKDRYLALQFPLTGNERDESVKELYELTCKGATDNWIPADYELYGNFVHKTFPEMYVMEKIKTSMRGEYKEWKNEELEAYIEEMKGTDYDTFTAHTWI